MSEQVWDNRANLKGHTGSVLTRHLLSSCLLSSHHVLRHGRHSRERKCARRLASGSLQPPHRGRHEIGVTQLTKLGAVTLCSEGRSAVPMREGFPEEPGPEWRSEACAPCYWGANAPAAPSPSPELWEYHPVAATERLPSSVTSALTGSSWSCFGLTSVL